MDDSYQDTFSIDANVIRQILPTVFQRCAFNPPQIEDQTRTAVATKSIQDQGYFPGTSQIQAIVNWTPVAGGVRVSWVVYDTSHGQRVKRERLMQDLGEALRGAIANWVADAPVRHQSLPVRDPVVKPGEVFGSIYTGTLRDYSACATISDVQDLTSGSLPLGSYCFGFGAKPEILGPELYLARFRSGAPIEYNGVLICAPQNSGKTSLIVRWAEAASKKPYAIFLIDVKGNLRQKLAGKLAGEVYCFSTDPADQHSDRINFLDGPAGLTPTDTDRIRQLVTALLPSRGFVEQGGLDEYHYRNRVVWLTAFTHILKLAQFYCPDWFVDDNNQPRNVDLADLYELISDEEAFYGWIAQLQEKEAEQETPPLCGIDHWLFELAIMLDRDQVSIGQRPERDSFRTYSTALLTALEPFSKHGTLYRRIRSFGEGRIFDLETVLGGGQRPVTVILAARQQDLEKSSTILSLAIKRLQWFLFDRMAQQNAESRPVLLLLDETRRIRDFDAAEYITFAREAKACCVIAYQSLEQIMPPEKRVELLENVGTHIYLGSLVGKTALNFLSLLPRRSRTVVTRQIVRTANTETENWSISQETVDFLTSAEVYQIPGGQWPALVYINDQPRRPPFFVEMSDASNQGGTPSGPPTPPAFRASVPALPKSGKEIVVGPPRKKNL